MGARGSYGERFGRDRKTNSRSMKHTTFTFLAVAAAVAGTTSALADDPHLRIQLATQRAQMEREQGTVTTVAIYARDRGAGRYERVTTTRRGTEERPLMIHKGRGETQVIERKGRD
jgi:hypothetical protein